MNNRLVVICLMILVAGCARNENLGTPGGPTGQEDQNQGSFSSLGTVPADDTSHYTFGCAQPGQAMPDYSQYDARLRAGGWTEQTMEVRAFDGRAAFVGARSVVDSVSSPQSFDMTTTITSFRGDSFGVPVTVGLAIPNRCTISTSGGITSSNCVPTNGTPPTGSDALNCTLSNISNSTTSLKEVGTYRFTDGRRIAAHIERSSVEGTITCQGNSFQGRAVYEFYRSNDIPSRSNYFCGGEIFRSTVQYLDQTGVVRSELKLNVVRIGG